ncbi:MAG: hypothetical protein LBP22_07010 [Deltaproteobacteria bacterium]|jgi:hypothetical protein|nr:hypothetical protein [Deltaproteobacteria bacterium]
MLILIDIDRYHNKLPEQEIFCVKQPISIHGVNGKLTLYFDPHSHAQLCGELSDRIEQLSAELSRLKRCPKSNRQRYSKYFTLKKHDNSGEFDFHVNNDEVDKLRRGKGCFRQICQHNQKTHCLITETKMLMRSFSAELKCIWEEAVSALTTYALLMVKYSLLS